MRSNRKRLTSMMYYDWLLEFVLERRKRFGNRICSGVNGWQQPTVPIENMREIGFGDSKLYGIADVVIYDELNCE